MINTTSRLMQSKVVPYTNKIIYALNFYPQDEPAVYIKEVYEKEFIFTVLASNEGIFPKIISWKRDRGTYIIKSERYPATLMEQPIYSIYKEDGIKLITKLHSIGIFHSDITTKNFVVNPETKEIRLIDFGCSCWIEDITNQKLKNTYDEEAESIDDLLNIEIKELKWLCEQK